MNAFGILSRYIEIREKLKISVCEGGPCMSIYVCPQVFRPRHFFSWISSLGIVLFQKFTLHCVSSHGYFSCLKKDWIKSQPGPMEIWIH